jgi:LPPG:FO 2-phospho-L-lactate transferase
MSNDSVRTRVHLDKETVSFQEYFVKLQHNVAVTGVTFDGVETATFIEPSLFQDAARIIIAPSNPIVSIGPMRAIPGVDESLAQVRHKVVAISPIVAGTALKGPADRMLAELGHEPTVVGVARMYKDICATLIIDQQDAHLAHEVEKIGMRCIVTDTIMSRPGVSKSLAQHTLDATYTQGEK